MEQLNPKGNILYYRYKKGHLKKRRTIKKYKHFTKLASRMVGLYKNYVMHLLELILAKS